MGWHFELKEAEISCCEVVSCQSPISLHSSPQGMLSRLLGMLSLQ